MRSVSRISSSSETASLLCRRCYIKGAITSKIKHAIKHKTSPARLAQLSQPSLAFCFSLQPMTAYRPVQYANEGCYSCATVVQVLQDLFYVLLHVLFYLWSLLNRLRCVCAASRCYARRSSASTVIVAAPLACPGGRSNAGCFRVRRARCAAPSGTSSRPPKSTKSCWGSRPSVLTCVRRPVSSASGSASSAKCPATSTALSTFRTAPRIHRIAPEMSHPASIWADLSPYDKTPSCDKTPFKVNYLCLLPLPKKEVMFLLRSVCLSVCLSVG